MSEDTSEPKENQAVWVKSSDVRQSVIESALPIELDKERLLEHELDRVRGGGSWEGKVKKLGVGKEVLIRAGTPIRFHGIIFKDYVTREDIRGLLKQETTTRANRAHHYPHQDAEPGDISAGGGLYLSPKAFVEVTDNLFTVSVELPPGTGAGTSMEDMKEIDILVPNDMLELAEPPPQETT